MKSYRAVIDAYAADPEGYIFQQEWLDEIVKLQDPERELSLWVFLQRTGILIDERRCVIVMTTAIEARARGKRVRLNKPELLAPAGSLEKLKFAIHYGADAV